MNTYLLSYNPFAENFSIMQLFTFIKENKRIFQYYTPFAGCYILKSAEGTFVLQQMFRDFFETSQFVIAPLQDDQTGGALPAQIWPWVNGGQFPALTFS